MKEVTLADQVLDNLAFEVEEVPQDGQISSASSNSPLNVKIRIRKKNRKQLQDGGIISIPKIDHAAYDGEKVRVTSSDQTIMSFNVLMDRGQAIKKRPPKQKRIMQLFKRGGCLGVQNDEEQYEYSSTSQQPVKENELSESMENLSSDGLDRANFTLAKNYSNIEASQANKQKHTDFLGKCKPGGCLDPPFGEDKYSYLPKFIEVAGTDESETKTKFNECECKENLPGDNKIESKDEDKLDSSLIHEREKTVPIHDSNPSITQIKSSNSIITFPSILPSTEALNKEIQKRSRSYSGSRESKNYSISNQQLETYYISPKIKTVDQGLDRETVSKPYLDTKNVDIFSIKEQENLLGHSKPDADIKSDLESNKSFATAEKMALRSTRNDVITNDIMNNLTQDDKPVSLKDQEYGTESRPLMENHEPANYVIPETGSLYMDDSKILFHRQKVETDKKYLDKIPKENSQETNKKSLESILKDEDDMETIIALPHDLTVEKIDLKEMIGDKIVQETKESLIKSVESDEFKNKRVIETITLPKDYSTNDESLNAISVTSELPPEEINQTILPSLTKPEETIIYTDKSSIEKVIASPQNSLYDSKDLFIKGDAPMISSSIEQQLKDTSNSDIFKFSKNLEIDSTKGEHIIDTEIMPAKNYSFSDDDFNITQKLGVSSPEENLSVREATDNAKNENIVRSYVPRYDSLLDKELLKIMETAANAQLQERDRPIPLLSRSSEDKFMQLSNGYDSKVENHQENSIHSKISAEKKSLEDIKIETVVSTSLVSSAESNMERYSDSITKLSLQNDKEEKDELIVESFHTNKSDYINKDELALQHQDTSRENSVTNSDKISEMHVDINSGVRDIMNIENSEETEKTKLQQDEDQKKSKSGILQEEVYHKALEVTFSDKVMTERMETSENILSKPTFKTETPTDLEFDKSRDKTWGSKENLKEGVTIRSDNVPVNNDELKSFKDSLQRNYDEQDVIHLNMAFQSFETNQEGTVIKTLNFSSFDNANRYPNDNILQFKTIIRPNDGEIKIPIDSKKDLILQIKTDQRQKDQYGGSIKDFPILNNPIRSKYKSNMLNEDNDTGHFIPDNTLATKDNATTVTRTIPDESKPDNIDLQQTLDDVYKDKLLPLHDIIKKLKDDIEELTKQQTLIKEKLYKTKRVQSNYKLQSIQRTGKRCGCVEMLVSGQ